MWTSYTDRLSPTSSAEDLFILLSALLHVVL